MNQEKIGKFIARLRKEKNLTQEQLAEQLNISNRAVSKWERGINLPDASLMMKISDIFGITINELLSGELVKKNEYENKAEENLIELKKCMEEQNRFTIKVSYIFDIIDLLISILLLIIGLVFSLINPLVSIILILMLSFIWFLSVFASLSIEQKIGYFKCLKCGHIYTPTEKNFSFTLSLLGSTRLLKCPKCNKKRWSVKVYTK